MHFTDILTTAPGCKESVLFADDGFTLLNQVKEKNENVDNEENVDISVKINLEEVVENNAHLVGNEKYYHYFHIIFCHLFYSYCRNIFFHSSE